MRFLYSWLKDYIAIKESPQKLAEILNLYAFETSVARPFGRAHGGKADAVLDVELFPNRVGDAASHVGIARELAMILRRPISMAKFQIPDSRFKAANFVSVRVADRILCPRYSARVVDGVRIGQSPLWLKKRLAACGLRPINNVVDVTNYVMLELGEPMHAFDWDKLSVGGYQLSVQGNRKPKTENRKLITVRRAKRGEMIDALDAKPYTLNPDDIVIADAKGPLAIGGIKGGRRAEIDRKTKTVVLEAANFDPIAIRRTSKRLGLRTDSSWRFENGLDPNLTILALDRAALLIKQLCGGEIAKGIVDVYPKKTLPQPIVVDLEKMQSLVGEPITIKDVVVRLEPILAGVRVMRGAQRKILLRIRTERRDLRYAEDIAEEVARLRGYHTLQAVPAVAPLTPPAANEPLRFRDILRNHLAGLGFSEVYNYSFISEKDVQVFHLDRREVVEIENPKSGEAQYLRPGLLFNLLKNARDNFRFFDGVKLFEVGQYYILRDDMPEESWRLAGVVSRRGATGKDLFFETKGTLEALLERLGLDADDYKFAERIDDHLVPWVASNIFLNGAAAGFWGGVRPEILLAYDLKSPVAYWSLDVGSLMHASEEEHEYEPPHKYPDVIRDISFIISADRRIEEVQNVINAVSPKYLEDLDLFDVYEGPELGQNKQSLAFHLIFRAPDRTLTDVEVNGEMKKIVKALEGFGAEIR